MSSQIIVLTIMEFIKILVAVWLGLVLCKISITLDQFIETKPVKGRQLEHIKGHFRWLAGITLGGLLILPMVIWLFIEFAEWKDNYTQLWKDKSKLETEVIRLGGKL